MDSFGIHLSASWAAFLLMIINLNDFPNIVIFSTGNSPLHLAVMLGHKGEQHVQYHMTTNQEHNHPCQISQLARLWFMYLVNFQLYCQPQTNVISYIYSILVLTLTSEPPPWWHSPFAVFVRVRQDFGLASHLSAHGITHDSQLRKLPRMNPEFSTHPSELADKIVVKVDSL